MENAGALVRSESEPAISSLLIDISNQMQGAVQDMLKMTSEVDQSIGEINEDMEKCKGIVFEKSNLIEEEKERVQKAAMAVLQMLNGSDHM
ncbi:hypothetical protein LUZ60_012403 [Juncus effusus]|nr:hypothetical protein LUZ60_012397 [Juncus effusus]KAJ3692053.1 hypothetical protein LUZ60_012403 [Juncus effusus]